MKVKGEVRQQIQAQRGKCDQCGVTGVRFCFQRKIHHKQRPELANEPSNIWMRCEDCHKAWEEKRADRRRPEAKVNDRFKRRVRAERGEHCEVCGTPGPTQEELAAMSGQELSRRRLHLHHKNKQRTHPQMRCDRENIIVCCQACHVRMEAELNIELREQSAVVGNTSRVEHSLSEATTNTSPTADLKPATRVSRGREFSPPYLHEKCSGAQRPKATLEYAPHGTENATSIQPPVFRVEKCVHTVNQLPSLSLKLRNQAKKAGLIPGSPRWRSYVLGTEQAAKKRKRIKSENAKPEVTSRDV